MKIAFAVFILIHSFAFAQSLRKGLEGSILDFQTLNKEESHSSCEKPDLAEKKVAKTVVHCHCDDEDKKISKENFKSFQLTNIKVKDLPEQMKRHIPGKAFESAEGAIKAVISLPNDNKMLGLWGVAFGDDGDDFGATHGAGLSLSTTRKGMTYTFSGETNLFTKKAGLSYVDGKGRKIFPQYFTNENMLKFVVDNIQKDKVSYYKVGVGWIQLDSKNADGLIQASAQQRSWHKFLGIYGFDYISDGKKVRNGVNLDAFFGVQKNLLLGSSCRVRFFGESGAHLSTLNDDFFKLEAGTMLYIQRPKKNFTLKTGAKFNTKFHEAGKQFQTDLSLGANWKRFGVDLIYHVKQGDLQNHVNYNLANENGSIDPTLSMKFKYIFGQGRKKKKRKTNP